MKRKNLSILIKRIGCCLILACFCIPLCAFAEEISAVQKEEKSISKMDEMVVTATRIEERKQDVSASIQIISAEDIKNSTAKDAGDLMAEAGVGHVTNYGGAYTSTIEIRGLTTDGNLDTLQSRVLVLINGNRAGTVNFSTIPAKDVERIEIVKGPASVLYGSSAMGGVVNIITKQGKEEGFTVVHLKGA